MGCSILVLFRQIDVYNKNMWENIMDGKMVVVVAMAQIKS